MPPLPDSATPHVAALAGRLMEVVRQSLAHEDWHGLRPSHFRLLASVPPAGVTITELSTVMFMTKQAVGQFVSQLQESGHVTVQTDDADRRRRTVLRTDHGDATVAAVDAHIEELERMWQRTVGEHRYEQFRAVLAEISQSESRSPTSGPRP